MDRSTRHKILGMVVVTIAGFVMLFAVPGSYGPLVGLPLIIVAMVTAPRIFKQL